MVGSVRIQCVVAVFTNLEVSGAALFDYARGCSVFPFFDYFAALIFLDFCFVLAMYNMVFQIFIAYGKKLVFFCLIFLLISPRFNLLVDFRLCFSLHISNASLSNQIPAFIRC
jgi:lysylphosphatidylglycerol synthetase-like protein (DUF2156 family)